jgi:hypothetical protein
MSNATSSEGMHYENITIKPYPIKILTFAINMEAWK